MENVQCPDLLDALFMPQSLNTLCGTQWGNPGLAYGENFKACSSQLSRFQFALFEWEPL